MGFILVEGTHKRWLAMRRILGDIVAGFVDPTLTVLQEKKKENTQVNHSESCEVLDS